MENKITIYTDGGSRNNPGKSALGVYFPDFEKEYSEYLGIGTNNEAEYRAVMFALRKAKQLIGVGNVNNTEVEIRADSQLVVRQLNGEYKVKEPRLRDFFVEIKNLAQDYKKVIFTYIPREENKRADAMVNKELDKQENG